MDIKETTRQVTVFTTSDGEEFYTKEEALKHENDLIKYKKDYVFYEIKHGMDLTEGRSYLTKTLIYAIPRNTYHQAIALDKTMKIVKEGYGFVQGNIQKNCMLPNVSFEEITYEDVKHILKGSTEKLLLNVLDEIGRVDSKGNEELRKELNY